MFDFCLDEYCDCLEYDHQYDKDELSEILLSSNKDELNRFYKTLNRRQLSILKIIGDNYIQDGIPDRLLDIYLKCFALLSVTESFMQLPQN